MNKSVAALVAVMVAVPLVSAVAHHAVSPFDVSADTVTLHVGGSGPGNYSSIQAAVNDSDDGDRVFIHAGVYREHVTVSSSITITGASTDVVVNAGGNGSAFRLAAPGVRLRSLTVRSGGGGADDALVSTGHGGVSVSGCLFADARQGVVVEGASNVAVDNCTFSRVAKGISLLSSSQASVTDSTFYKNGVGIWARDTDGIEISRVWSQQGGTTVLLDRVKDVLIQRSTLAANNENQANLYAEDAEDIRIDGCRIHDSGFGAHLAECVNVTVTGCRIHNTKIAVRFSTSVSCSLLRSDVSDTDVAVYLIAAEDVTVSHNNFERNYVSTLAADGSRCDARYNWWGSRLGPVGEVHGSVMQVDTYPWLTSPENHSQAGGGTPVNAPGGSTVEAETGAVDNDTDGDGVPDWWEDQYGYDPQEWENHSRLDPDDDGLDNVEEYRTYEWGSHPYHKDLFIEVDVMDDSYRLTEKKKEQMTAAFAEHNISLHIDQGEMGGGEVIPSQDDVNYATLVDLYWTYFLHEEPDSWRKGVFHYVVLSESCFQAMPGFVFIGWDEADSFTLNMQYYQREIPAPFRPHVHATVFMHELGHTLGLFHGLYPGIDNESSIIPFPRPLIEGQLTYARYLSCMNYQYAWQILDYSDGSRGRRDFDDWSHVDLTFFQDSQWG